VVLAAIASGTSRIRLGVGIYLLPLRNPIIAARSLASLDVLSNGRLDLGVGLGWTKDEYDLTERDWTTRGKRLDECIQALKALFEQPEPEFHGELIDFPKVGFEPKPVQRPFPIHVGGFSRLGARRAALLGTGWYGSADYIPEIRQIRAEAGLADQPFEFSSLSMAGPMARENLEALAGQGVERAVVVPWTSRKPVGLEGIDMLEDYARAVGL
ncbi:MAG: putative F420-dependent oxidoreductase, partial [Phenylobacterium sp.]|nr:putative F420-dependent oxidoreductase [Phenylobacterium sp.]